MIRSKPRDKRSWRPPKSRDESYQRTRQSTKITKSLPKFINLPKHNGNRQQIWVYVVIGATHFKRGDDHVQKMRPTDKRKAHREAVYRATLRSRPANSYWQAKSPPGCSLPRHTPRHAPRHAPRSRPSSLPRSRPRFYRSRQLRATMKSTGWSLKRTSKDDYRIKINLWVNAEYQGLLAARYTL